MRLTKFLPGELKGEVSPQQLGFDEVPEPLSDAEIDLLMGEFYARTKRRTGIIVEALEPYLENLPDMSDDDLDDDAAGEIGGS